jgi:hypothetical protein
MTALAGWQNFYVIVGSSAGALIGLQFVVLSLITRTPTARGDAEIGGAFATPTIVHFGAVLGLSGILSAPWDGIGGRSGPRDPLAFGYGQEFHLAVPPLQW